ncbi:Methyl-accepting chemotaxis protein [Pseudomonas syringae pv. cerasicola]|uniref:Methyl-accepting chemotaxis protein n=3 Tax=Pseudomonas TaxID=286 RepID=A0A0P9MLP1_PSESX|nr:Methyl-accepting chemotaxis protein [Pseudomonas syringae pv. cerasicola]RMS74461.1 Methyl-accepting chemotaxis protein [Pseudomonas savastanoi]RMS78487.1 Methyl-accepting chemotaxis protein [Pseudomonas savastanoi]
MPLEATMNIRSLNISRRASLFFGVITLLLIGLGGFSYVQIDHLRTAEQNIEENSLPSIQVVDDIQIALLHARLESIRMLASTDPAVHSTAEAKAREAIAALRSNSEFYRKNLISGASAQLSTAAVEMTSITESADRTLQQQNSEIEQAATAVNEMSAAVEEVARNATSTSQAAQQSSLSADLGNQRVTETLTAMHNLTGLVEGSSAQVTALAGQAQDISKVLGVIRGIAEQTNLLALNAAIEAARAGEQGRGFAVVADEVRALAHRTQTSTQEVEQMISAIQAGSSATVESMQKSTQEVHSTRKTAEDAGQSLRQITDSVLEINNRNLQIAAASEQQAHVARDVDRSLISIRDLAVQSSEGTRQTLIASTELSQLAVNLNDLVLRFKT